MKIQCYGARGSLPTPISSGQIEEKIRKTLSAAIMDGISSEDQIDDFLKRLPFEYTHTYGGNTTCIHILDDDGKDIILDCGSGLKNLGMEMMKREFSKGQGECHIFMTHTHWDHMMGFPFFAPAFIPGNKIYIYSPKKKIKERFAGQQRYQYFPVRLNEMGGTIIFKVIPENSAIKIGNTVIRNLKLNHPGDSYSYRVECGDKSCILATDVELFLKDFEFLQSCVRFFEQSDVLLFDAQYTFEESLQKISWGHSSTTMAVDMALKAGIKELWLFHHEPTYTDDKLKFLQEHALKYLQTLAPNSKLQIMVAYEGLIREL